MNHRVSSESGATVSAEGVSVIIRTNCADARRESLERSLSSILSQSVPVEPIVVVNGPWLNRDLFADLSRRPELKVVYMEEACLPGAMRLGRSLVTHPYFAFLDDDDIFLPDALATRVNAIRRTGADVLVTAGILSQGQPSSLDADAVNADPLRSLLQQNWLSSCGGLFRSATVPVEFFDHLPDVYEWTALGFELLAAGKNFRYVADITYRLFDTPGSVSKGFRTKAAEVERKVLERAAATCGRPDLKSVFRRKIGEAAHLECEMHYANGDLREAWRCHWKSLRMGGLRHLAFTRRLVGATLGMVSPSPRPRHDGA